MSLHDFFSQMDWSKVQRIHTSRNGKFYSFSIEVHKKLHMVSIGMGPGTTTLTISDMEGHILEHVVQQGKELVFYRPKEGSLPSLTNSLGQLAPISIVDTNPDAGIHERGV
ncbi:Uncharacterised protein [uncultured archaeon]|nr:Uncharacterised protein [uncultured archaeon]